MSAAASGMAFQRAFAAALVAGDGGAAATTTGETAIDRLVAQPAFAVYRNTVTTGWLDAMVANHPTLHALTGDAWFRGAAREYLRRHPPRDALLARIGDGFPAFAQALPSAAGTPYLRDVGRLDRLWTESHLAPDAPVLRVDELAGLDVEAFAALRLRLHPATRWASLADAPAAFSIWRRHREALPLDAPLPDRMEHACLVRPDGAVAWLALDAAGIALVAACAEGLTVDEALERADEGSAPNATEVLVRLVAAGAFASDRTENRP